MLTIILVGLFILAALSDGYSIVAILIVGGIIGFIYYCFTSINNERIEKKNPLDVDNTKMAHDIANGVSQAEIRRRYGNGYYDKDKK